MSNPFLSVVIANYNYGCFLEDALNSILSQNVGQDVEVIVCDAKSTDNSVDIIRKFAKGLPSNTNVEEWLHGGNNLNFKPGIISWWCSEKDSGQSEAFNKGFSHARGEWLTWLNADEIYLPGALRAFVSKAKRLQSANWITSNMLSFDDETRTVVHVSWGPHLQPWFLRKNHAPHAVFGPSSFLRRSLYEQLGPIDESFRYAMDVDYWARLTMAGISQTRLNIMCWAFRIHRHSKTAGNQDNGIAEERDGECVRWHTQNSYFYKYSLRNIWYILWLLCRVLDGSMIVKIVKQVAYTGSSIDSIVGGNR